MYRLKKHGLQMHSRIISMTASGLLITMAAAARAGAPAGAGIDVIPDGLQASYSAVYRFFKAP
jgi:hypothetical protein